MVGIFKKLSEKLSNKMLAPGAEEHDGYYDEERGYDEDYYYEEDYYEEPEPLQVRYTNRSNQTSRKSSQKSSSTALSTASSRKDNVYGFAGAINVHKQSEAFITHPKGMEDAVQIGSHVRSGRMCIVDLTGVATPEAQRIADYLCGATDSIDGAINRINNTMMAVTPPNFRIMNDYREEAAFKPDFFQKKAANDR